MTLGIASMQDIGSEKKHWFHKSVSMTYVCLLFPLLREHVYLIHLNCVVAKVPNLALHFIE